MAGDTAYTIDSANTRGTLEDRAFKGLVKVLPVQSINAGISYWGWSTMPPGNTIHSVWMDWWIRDYLIRNHNNFNSIDELAALLETELRRLVPRLTQEEINIQGLGSGGVHLAGFTEYNRQLTPSFWHIHNGISQALPEKDLDPTLVNANHDCPPEIFLNSIQHGQIPTFRNGDFEPYARFFDRYLIRYLDELDTQEDFIVPLDNHLSRAEWIRAQIRFISELYSVGGDRMGLEGDIHPRVRSISDEVTLLLSTPDGIRGYFTR